MWRRRTEAFSGGTTTTIVGGGGDCRVVAPTLFTPITCHTPTHLQLAPEHPVHLFELLKLHPHVVMSAPPHGPASCPAPITTMDRDSLWELIFVERPLDLAHIHRRVGLACSETSEYLTSIHKYQSINQSR